MEFLKQKLTQDTFVHVFINEKTLHVLEKGWYDVLSPRDMLPMISFILMSSNLSTLRSIASFKNLNGLSVGGFSSGSSISAGRAPTAYESIKFCNVIHLAEKTQTLGRVQLNGGRCIIKAFWVPDAITATESVDFECGSKCEISAGFEYL